MAGRKPLPTALHLIRGNPGKRKRKHEPRPAAYIKAPAPPPHLRPLAKAEWRRIVPQLMAIGILTKLDRAELEAYCRNYATAKQCEEQLKTADLMLMSGETGNFYPNPLVNMQAGADAKMKAFATEFGLSPSSRARIAVPKAKDPDDDF